MRYPTSAGPFRRRRIIVVALATALLFVAVTTYAVLVHRSASSNPASIDSETGTGLPTDAAPKHVVAELPDLRATSDPETFARSVAEALFTWDTTTLVTRADHVEQLIAVADPTGESTLGLASDLDNYMPTQEAWVDLAQYETRQWLTIESVATPSKWAEAEAQAGDELLPGTGAYTVEGTRHRSGVWEEAPVSSEHDVAFTIFIVCSPSYPKCHLLRLSMLDKPLD